MRAISHYVFAFVMLSIYGGQVCPFIESLGLFKLAVILAVFFAVMFALRRLLLNHVVLDKPYQLQTARQFFLELGLAVGGGVIFVVYNTLANGFPVSSGLKVFIGFFTFGFFAAADLSLEREREIVREVEHTRQEILPDETYTPVTRKFALVTIVCAIAVTLVIFLIFNKDLDWIVGLEPQHLVAARLSVLGEVGFVMLVLLIEVINLILSFSKNLHLFLNKENLALKQVAAGNLDAFVPVGTADEFGVMAGFTNHMIDSLRERTRLLLLTQDVTIMTLSSLAETRDPETGGHILRTQRYVKALAEKLCTHPRFRDYLTDETIDLLFKSAPLHDVGKVGVPDHILLKPGRLTDDEFEEMKKHTTLGRDAIQVAEDQLGQGSFLSLARQIAYTHQEKYDGSGYPQGLKADVIPISGRLMAVADVYDALISKRVYKPPFSHEKAVSIIKEGRGTHFDPDMVDAFLEIEDQFRQIALEFADFEEERTMLARQGEIKV